MDSQTRPQLTTVLDHIGAGVLIFDAADQLIFDNASARRLLGANLVLIRAEGWSAIAMLIDVHPGDYKNAQDLRLQAQRAHKPLRFSMLLGGSYMPCWVAAYEEHGQSYTQVVINDADWTALTELMGTFRAEARSAITDTSGHAEFLRQLLSNPPAKLSAVELGERSLGMLGLISIKMYRMQLLVDMLHRLELIRTGQLAQVIINTSREIELEDFVEDFMEELHEEAIVDPNADQQAYQQRLIFDLDDNLFVQAPPTYLRHILRDILRNALMYSEPDTPVKVRIASASGGRHVEFVIQDQGYGVRAKETERVFEPFQRARQPHIMREHGYGLSLYLVKAEVEALGGRIWFESEEGVGSTFSFKLPAPNA